MPLREAARVLRILALKVLLNRGCHFGKLSYSIELTVGTLTQVQRELGWMRKYNDGGRGVEW